MGDYPPPGYDYSQPQVYYMWSDEWPVVKIGTSKDWTRRAEELRQQYPAFGNGGWHYLLSEPGSYALEKVRHLQFARSRIGGEFFLLTPDLRAHLDQLHATRLAHIGDAPWPWGDEA